jgi:hypothetical protein
MVRASAHGCAAGINYANMLTEFQTGNLVGNAFWLFSTRIFPSTLTQDNKLEAAWLSYDALLAGIEPGVGVPVSEETTWDKFNPGALRAIARTDDANEYMIMVTTSIMGATQNRYGAPAPSYKKMQALPWSTQAGMDDVGCAYAASVVSFFDSVNQASTLFPSGSASALQAASAIFSAGIDDACDKGCRGLDTLGNPVAADGMCTFLDCSPCPNWIRARQTCVGDLRVRCAAAGVVRFANDGNLLGWQDGP